ncbi:MAG: hypothetical protein V9G98_16845 [Candidatus Competibacter sp.]|jgi:hypothetical protein
MGTSAITLPVTARIENLDEVVTVPFGTIKQCLKVSKFGQIQKDMGWIGKANIKVEEHTWYAPEIGIVQFVLKEQGHPVVGSAQAVMQLESFKK